MSAPAAGTAHVWKDEHWDRVKLVSRTEWQIDLHGGGRKRVGTRREAIEWCEKHGYVVLVTGRPS